MKLVILDRDGVINFDSDHHIKSPNEWKPIPGSLEAITQLGRAGYRIAIATNQSGIGRRLFDMDTLNQIHEKMHRSVIDMGGRIDAIFYCPHVATDECDCRKPKSGLFNQISERFGVDLNGVPAIGDSLRDLQAATTVGCQAMLVLTGKGEKTKKEGGLPNGTLQFSNLEAAVTHILS